VKSALAKSTEQNLKEMKQVEVNGSVVGRKSNCEDFQGEYGGRDLGSSNFQK
jgi:hypothetical protein